MDTAPPHAPTALRRPWSAPATFTRPVLWTRLPPQVYATSVSMDDGTSIYRVLLYGLAAEVGAMIIWYLAGFITLNLLIKQIKGACLNRGTNFAASVHCSCACAGLVCACADVLLFFWIMIPASSAALRWRAIHSCTRITPRPDASRYPSQHLQIVSLTACYRCRSSRRMLHRGRGSNA